MANNKQPDDKPISRVTYDGRTVVDVNLLVKRPKVQEALKKISSMSIFNDNRPVRIVLRSPNASTE